MFVSVDFYCVVNLIKFMMDDFFNDFSNTIIWIFIILKR